MYVHTHTHTRIHTDTHTHTHTCTRTHDTHNGTAYTKSHGIWTHICVNIHVYLYTTHVYAYIYSCTSRYICTQHTCIQLPSLHSTQAFVNQQQVYMPINNALSSVCVTASLVGVFSVGLAGFGRLNFDKYLCRWTPNFFGVHIRMRYRRWGTCIRTLKRLDKAYRFGWVWTLFSRA